MMTMLLLFVLCGGWGVLCALTIKNSPVSLLTAIIGGALLGFLIGWAVPL